MLRRRYLKNRMLTKPDSRLVGVNHMETEISCGLRLGPVVCKQATHPEILHRRKVESIHGSAMSTTGADLFFCGVE
jgi:hypothetical protein